MASVNKVIILGNLGRDPEIKTNNNGTTIANFSIATTRKSKDTSGNLNEETEWHRIVAFGDTAKNVGKYVHKGDPLFVEGRLRTRKYTGKDGVERYQTEIVLEQMQFLSRSRDAQQDSPQQAQRPAPRQQMRPQGNYNAAVRPASQYRQQAVPQQYAQQSADDLPEDAPF